MRAMVSGRRICLPSCLPPFISISITWPMSWAEMRSPTGGLRISAHDMGQVMLMLMNGGRHEGKQILRPDTIARMFARQWSYDGKGGNGDSYRGLFNCWGLGNQQFPDRPGTGMQLVEGGGFPAVGH